MKLKPSVRQKYMCLFPSRITTYRYLHGRVKSGSCTCTLGGVALEKELMVQIKGCNHWFFQQAQYKLKHVSTGVCSLCSISGSTQISAITP